MEDVEGDKAIDDDPFELAPIIEAVMNDHKGKKRSYQDVEYTLPIQCVEPKRNRPRKSLFLEAEETSHERFPKSP